MSLAITPGLSVYVALGATDMRRSFRGLVAATREVLGEEPTAGHLFAFCNRRRTLIKLLMWDGTGFWIFAKRLEQGTFAWPEAIGQSKLTLSSEELGALLGGFALDLSTRRRWSVRES